MPDSNIQGLTRRIPEGIKLAVRQRCQFGCVVCGSVIVQYHHFNPPFEDASEHIAAGITLLCGGCHDQATRRLLAPATVSRADAEPYCSRNPPSHLMDLRLPIRIAMGGAVFLGTGPLIVVDGVPVFEIVIKDGVGYVNARFADESGRTAVEIKENELTVCTGSWDVAFVGPRLVVRSAPGKIAFECILHPPHGLFIREIDIARHPYRVRSDESGFNLFNQNGKNTDLGAGYVWVLGGCIEMGHETFQIVDGVMIAPYPLERFLARARAGEIAALVDEVAATTRQPVPGAK